MNRLTKKIQNLRQRKGRVRAVVTGTSERPRLSVHISNRHVVAQLIDDSSHKTLAHATTVANKAIDQKATMTDKASQIGEEIAKKAAKVKVTKVVFDRGGRLYHGRVQALADSARKNGLEF